jgi:hypothetical protein
MVLPPFSYRHWKKAVFKTSFFIAVMNFCLGQAVPSYIPLIYAQEMPVLPESGSVSAVSAVFSPAIITGLIVNPDEPLQFDFILDTGDHQLQGQALENEADKLIRYFFAALTIPDDEFWVNLSPHENDRIITSSLAATDLGRDLLAQDYMLKRITSLLTHPQGTVGSEYWKRLEGRTRDLYGIVDAPVDTFNRVWIVPEKAVVYEHGHGAFVGERHLKVMFEQDYYASEQKLQGKTKDGDAQNASFQQIECDPLKDENHAQIMREVILPVLEREVNEGGHFANLRQIYNAMILAAWYKQTLRESFFSKVYVDQKKIRGVESEDQDVKQKIYKQYMEMFISGVYDYVKEEYDPVQKSLVPRHYFSGGAVGVKEVQIWKLDLNKPVDPVVISPSNNPSVKVSSRVVPLEREPDTSMLAVNTDDLNLMRLMADELRENIHLIDLMNSERLFLSAGQSNDGKTALKNDQPVMNVYSMIEHIFDSVLLYQISLLWRRSLWHERRRE